MRTRSSVHWGREGSERSQGRSRSQSKGRGRLLDFRGQKPFHTAQFPGVCPQLVSTGVPNLSKLQYFGHLMQRAGSLEKTLMVWKIESRRSNITHYQRNANQGHNEVPFHTSQNGCDSSLQAINAGEDVEKREPLTLLVGMQTSTATMENSVEIP